MNADTLAELERLGDLRTKGVLTDAEFQLLKARVTAPSSTTSRPAANPLTDADEALVRRLATYEQVSGIVWLIIAALQILGGLAVSSDMWLIIAGAWNIFAGLSRFAVAKRIRARDSSVPATFKRWVQLVIIGLINLFVGGVIGLIWIGFDVFVRWQVLKNSRLFAKPGVAPPPAAAPTTAVPASS